MKIIFFPLVVVFYALSVWHFLLVYFEFISLSVKYSLVKCFNSPFLIDDLWDCISQSDSMSPIGSLETRAIFATVSQAQKSTFVSTFKFTHFSTGQALRDLSCHFFHVSMHSNLFYHLPAVIIIGPLSATHPFAPMLAQAILQRRSQSSLSLE